ncbi:amidase family protein [Methylocystis suflitae]|uniref:amidase family protein n=1 Tax=Methylocystis suflitae TaxID=2951405 RepID=UPI00210D82EC|nr:amidase family protein [Methylocystis suflitae]MCQ4190979.1 amidase family protein [Methylocystis suflitae]
MIDLLSLDATDQIKALTAKHISARELLEASIARVEALDAQLNAVVAKDLDRARAEAQHIDERRARGENLGPLAGLPMTVKDHFDIEGFPASFGGDASLLNRKVKDAAVIKKVRGADAVIWGRTNLALYGGDVQTYNALYGTTNNPWDVTRTPGGSSGGSAVALATGMTALEIGSDIGGSLRHPANFCGVFTHKPTYGLVSQGGFCPASEPVLADMDLAVIGPMARSVRDLRLLLSIMTDAEISAQAPSMKLREVNASVWFDEPSFALDPEIKAPLAAFAEKLAVAGANVAAVACPVATEPMMFAYTTLLYGVLGSAYPWPVLAFYELLRGPARLALAMGAKPLSLAQALVGLTARHREWLVANEKRAKMSEAMREFFSRFDVLIAPVAPVAAFPHDHGPLPLRRLTCSDGRVISYLEMINWIAIATVLGLPATVVPAGFTKSGLPVGVQIIGPRGGDALTLSVAQAIEKEIGGFRAPALMQAHEMNPQMEASELSSFKNSSANLGH